MKLPLSRSRQVELGMVEGSWSSLQLLQQVLVQYLNAEHQAHWLLMQNERNQLHHVNDDVIELEHIILRHLEFHDRTLYRNLYFWPRSIDAHS